MKVTFSIGELARPTRTKVETIRYYERIGLLPGPPVPSAIIAPIRDSILSG